MPQLIPIKDMRNTTKMSDICHATDEPIYITKNGYGGMVILSMGNYESRLSRVGVFDKVMNGKEQADRGDLLDGDEALASLRTKYGRKVQAKNNTVGI